MFWAWVQFWGFGNLRPQYFLGGLKLQSISTHDHHHWSLTAVSVTASSLWYHWLSPNNPCRAIPKRIDIFCEVTTQDLQPLWFLKPRRFLRESYRRATSSTMDRVWIIAEWQLFLNRNCHLILTKSSQFCIWPWRVIRYVVYTHYKGVINFYGDQIDLING